MSSDKSEYSSDTTQPEGVPLYRTDIVVKWGDMDALGHVNNAQYFRYFEQTRLAWYHETGFGVLGATTDGFVIVNNYAEYHRAVTWPATVTVRMAGHSPGRSSFMSTYSLCVDNELYTTGYSKVVWINTQTNKSIDLPQSVRELLTSSS